MSVVDLKENPQESDEKTVKARKRYTLWGKIVLGISIVLLIGGFLGFVFSSIEVVEDFLDDCDVSPAIFVIPFVIGMFGMVGGTFLLGLGKGKRYTSPTHTIIINESSTTAAPEKQDTKKGGKCPNCGATYKAEDKTCKYCGSDL